MISNWFVRGRHMWILFKTLIFTLLFPGTVAVYLPYWILAHSTVAAQAGPVRYVGLLPLAAGIAAYLWCAWDFVAAGDGTPAPMDPPRLLVVRGLYRYVRNPMYIAIVSILIGESIFFHSLNLLIYSYAVFLLFNIFIIFYEEPALKRKFGEKYAEYCEAVPRWMPGKRPSRSGWDSD